MSAYIDRGLLSPLMESALQHRLSWPTIMRGLCDVLHHIFFSIPLHSDGEGRVYILCCDLLLF